MRGHDTEYSITTDKIIKTMEYEYPNLKVSFIPYLGNLLTLVCLLYHKLAQKQSKNILPNLTNELNTSAAV